MRIIRFNEILPFQGTEWMDIHWFNCSYLKWINNHVLELFQACQVPDIILNYFLKNPENDQIGFLQKETRRIIPDHIFS
jgi:hypothetical protein